MIKKYAIPNADNVRRYDELFREYKLLHDYFGKGGNNVMKRLKGIKNDAMRAKR